ETHKAPRVHRWLLRHPRVHLHLTLTYGAWLNLVERFLAVLTERALKRGSHTSVCRNSERASAPTAPRTTTAEPFRWTKTADEILGKLRRFGTRTLQLHGS